MVSILIRSVNLNYLAAYDDGATLSRSLAMNTILRLLLAPLSATLLLTALPLQAVRATPAKVESLQTVAQFPSPPSQSSSINVTGVVRFVNVEGGCYRLETSDGRSFELLGQFPKKDGLRVQVRGRLLRDTATVCQVGQPLQVESVLVLQPDSQQRALEVSIFGIGPAVDQRAVESVRSVIGRAVTEGVIDTYLTYGYGIEGGTSSCIQLSRFQDPKRLLQLRNQLLRIKPNPETTSYTVQAVTACRQQPSSPAQASEQLADTEWVLNDLGGSGVIGSPHLTLRFTGTNRLEGQGGCNSYAAQSQVDGDRLTISALVATKRACVNQRSQEQENRYFRALEGAQRFSLEDSELLIYSQGLAKPLRLTRLTSSSKTTR